MMKTNKKEGKKKEESEAENQISGAIKRAFFLILAIGLITGSALTLIVPYLAILPIGFGAFVLLKEGYSIIQSYREG